MKKTDNKPTEKAVIYARYSSSGQREESIEGQIRECRAYAKRNNMVVVGEYTDHALTGRTDKRPDFQRMVKDSEKGLFDVVICWKIDRFARNRYDSATYKHRLKKNGVRVVYAKESVPEGPEGIILESVMEGYAEYYSENLAQNVKRGYYENALACKVLTSPCFGYVKGDDGRYAVDPVKGEIVKRIFSEILSGTATKDIVTWLNSSGYRTYRGGKFTMSSVEYILKNEKYVGVYEYEDIRIEDGIPALVSRSDFEEVQIIMKHRAKAPAAKQAAYLLSTKLFCGACGCNYVGEYATSQNGNRYYYYACMGKRGHKCDAPRLNKDELEKFITDELVKLLLDDNFIEEVADAVIEYQKEEEKGTRIPALEARLADIERRLNNMATAIEEGLSTPTTRARLKELEEQRIGAERELAEELLARPNLDRDHIIFFLEKMRSGDADDPKYKERLVETFLQKAYIYPERIVISLNYSGKSATLTKDMADTLKAPQNGAFNGVRIDTVESESLRQVRTVPIYLFPTGTLPVIALSFNRVSYYIA